MDAVFAPASADAAIISQMAWVLIAGAALIFGGVMLLLGLSLRRRGQGGAAGAGGRVLRPGLWIVGGGVLLPVAVLSALMAYNVVRSAQLDPQTSRGALLVSVTARMWWWEVRYSDPSGGADIVLANELHLPADRPVYLALTSTDVIHSFWVPALAGKMDMVPGRMTGLSLRPVKTGVYRGQCAEYCGIQHARMALHVVVEPPAAFSAWLAQQARPQPLPAVGEGGAPLALGRELFLQHCAACHAVRTAGGAAGLAPGAGPLQLSGAGPDLTHVASRLYLAAGTLRNEPGAMAAWIADPNAHKAGVRMPAASGVDPESLRALAAYLEQLK
ncbi:cytochrome C oxidase subunit II [Massilia sp. Root351]|jgi:cytochrome c oxidase subunit 2|uniref:cytochrome c oxidase subunit II n=1 Tax=Massilia sp. Root351 TaxID=1736522 RepID=UPI00070E6F78|nr:c-type cytochrome [Massilia sp. Root351]KQV82350.1 cytochrome C oxidase subunit II [Massilia sp. Root351]